MDAGAARRREGVELHVEALVAGGNAGVADCDGHGSMTPRAPPRTQDWRDHPSLLNTGSGRRSRGVSLAA